MNKSWSILMWTIFLSLFISVFFISFQSKLWKYFTFSSLYNKKIETISKIDDIIFNLKKAPKISLDINNDYYLESLDFDWSNFFWFLNFNEATEYMFTNSGWMSITWSIISGWPLLYKLIKSDPSFSIYSSWIIEDFTWIILPNSWSWILYLQSLWWYSNFKISIWQSDLIPVKNIYKLIQKIAWYNNFLWNIEIKNFWIKSFLNLDYDLFWMYLNTN